MWLKSGLDRRRKIARIPATYHICITSLNARTITTSLRAPPLTPKSPQWHSTISCKIYWEGQMGCLPDSPVQVLHIFGGGRLTFHTGRYFSRGSECEPKNIVSEFSKLQVGGERQCGAFSGTHCAFSGTHTASSIETFNDFSSWWLAHCAGRRFRS